MPVSEKFKQLDPKLLGRTKNKKMKEKSNQCVRDQLVMFYKQNPLHFYKANKPDLLEHNRNMEHSFVGTYDNLRTKI
jgi:hypothetical protein